MSDASEFIGRGISFPLRVDQSGAIAMTAGADDIDSSIRMILTTAPGERVMRPFFGCRIWELLFEPINANTIGLMGEAVREAISRWEPRVHLEKLEIVPDPGVDRRREDPARLPGAGDQRPPQPGVSLLRHPPRGRVMSLPVTNLDDRRFQDIVDEAKRLIPQLCPEWTNHNLSDPGVALIELFAWMTESMLFRLNQVPDVFYTRMLNLLGFEQYPASAARAAVTFWCAAGDDRVVTVPMGTQVSTVGVIGETRVFTTLADTSIRSPKLIAAMTGDNVGAYNDVWEDLSLGIAPVPIFPREQMRTDDAFYLGFEETLAGSVIQLDISATVEGIGVVPHRPPLVWEVWQGEGWAAAEIPDLDGNGEIADTTGGLNRDGQIVLVVPEAHEPLTLGAVRAFWVRARLLPAGPDRPAYRTTPRLTGVRATTLGGTVLAEHSELVPTDVLGRSDGKPDQTFLTRTVAGAAARRGRDARSGRRRHGRGVDRGHDVHRLGP